MTIILYFLMTIIPYLTIIKTIIKNSLFIIKKQELINYNSLFFNDYDSLLFNDYYSYLTIIIRIILTMFLFMNDYYYLFYFIFTIILLLNSSFLPSKSFGIFSPFNT